MTFCFIASIPGVVVAAADTRVVLHHDLGGPVVDDGPRDLPLELTTLGRTAVIRYRQRKIRFLGTGWAVIAGEFMSGSLVLDELHAAKAARFDLARMRLDVVSQDVVPVEAESGGRRFVRDSGVGPAEVVMLHPGLQLSRSDI